MPVKIIGPDKTYIDYFQGICRLQGGLTNRFGIRGRDGLCLTVVKLGDRQINAYGKEFRLPVQLEMLSIHVRMIVHDPCAERAAANGAERLPNTSEQVYEGKSR